MLILISQGAPYLAVFARCEDFRIQIPLEIDGGNLNTVAADAWSPESGKRYHHHMAEWRAILSLIVVFVWTATPVLACLPSSTMTKVEMECCKKMAGDCHMGARNHPCCEKSVNQTSPVAELQRTHVLQVAFTAIASSAQLPERPTREVELSSITLGLPPPAPPNPNSILRI
jgi:hypothetical protein